MYMNIQYNYDKQVHTCIPHTHVLYMYIHVCIGCWVADMTKKAINGHRKTINIRD